MDLSPYKGQRILVVFTEKAAKSNMLEQITGSLTHHPNDNGEIRLLSSHPKGAKISIIPQEEIAQIYYNETIIYQTS